MMTRNRTVRFRAEADDVISGDVVVYGDTAIDENGRLETFLPGSLIPADPILNLQHDRKAPLARLGAGLELTDSEHRLRLRAKLPDSHYGRIAKDGIAGNLLRGLSIEYLPYEGGEVIRGGEVTIQRAALLGIALVDKPAYAQSVLIRQLQQPLRIRQRGVTVDIAFGGEPFVTSALRKRKMLIEPGALELAPDGVILLHGDYDKPLASSAEGTLQVDLSERGVSMRASSTALGKSPYWKDARRLIRAGLLTGVTPGIQRLESEHYDDDDGYVVERIRRGYLCEGYLRSREGAAPIRTVGRRRRWLYL